MHFAYFIYFRVSCTFYVFSQVFHTCNPILRGRFLEISEAHSDETKWIDSCKYNETFKQNRIEWNFEMINGTEIDNLQSNLPYVSYTYG